MERPSGKREWVLTQQAFNNLLFWLDPDLNRAGERYEIIRRGLVRYFRGRGCASPEDLADETINRVSQKVPDLRPVYVGEPARYFFGVARYVYLEYLRRQPRESEIYLEYLRKKALDADEFEERPVLPEHKFIALALIRDQIKPVSLTADGTYRFLDDHQNLHSLIYLATAETLKLRTAVEELESLVNNSRTKENDFQNFFEKYPKLIINDEYKRAHPHILLTRTDGEILIPDFLLEPLDQSSLCDLLELKLPSSQIFVMQKRRIRFSSAVFEACSQLRTYSQFFDEERNRKDIQERYGLLAYKPKMLVIIGRRGNISPIELRQMELDVPNLVLRTYDDLITRAKARLNTVK